MTAKLCNLGRPHAPRQCNDQRGQNTHATVALQTQSGKKAANKVSYSTLAQISGVRWGFPSRLQAAVNVGGNSSHAEVSSCSAQTPLPPISNQRAGKCPPHFPTKTFHSSRMSPPNAHSSSVMASDPPQQATTLRVAVDVDEVLGSFLNTLNIFCAEEYSTRHELHEFYVYDFMKIWNCSQAEANERVHAFFDSSHFTNGIPPIPGAWEVLQRLKHHCHLVIVTSRQFVIQQPTLEWVEKHYPGIFEEVHFGNHFALEGISKPKSEICKSLGAHILIDDNPRYAMECAERGIEVLLFDWQLAYPWSKTAEGPHHPLITRVQNWAEVEAAIVTACQREEGRRREGKNVAGHERVDTQ